MKVKDTSRLFFFSFAGCRAFVFYTNGECWSKSACDTMEPASDATTYVEKTSRDYIILFI